MGKTEKLLARASEASAKEKELNTGVIAAKTAHLASPEDEKLLNKYNDLKASYKVAYQIAMAAKLELKQSGYVPPKNPGKPKAGHAEGAEVWTCSLCDVTITLKDGDFNRQAHEKGKQHKKKVEESLAGNAEPKVKSKPEDKEHLKWTCKLCRVTIASTARETHLSGKKHGELSAKRVTFIATSKLGDWLCHCGQHNFSSKTRCAKEKCQLSKGVADTLTPAGTKPQPPKAPKAKQPPEAAPGSDSGAAKRTKKEADPDAKVGKSKTKGKPDVSSLWLEEAEDTDTASASTGKKEGSTKKRKSAEAEYKQNRESETKNVKKKEDGTRQKKGEVTPSVSTSPQGDEDMVKKKAKKSK